MRPILNLSLLTIVTLLVPSWLHATPVHEWSHCLGGPNTNTAYDVAVDGSGNVVVVGSFTGTMTIGGQEFVSAGNSDIFLAKFDARGTHQWSRQFGGTGLDVGTAVTIDGAGNVIMTGYFKGPVNFGGEPLVGRAVQDIFVAKFDAAGLHQWSHWYGSSGNDQGLDIAVDRMGNVVLTGHYGATIDFGGGTTPAFGGFDVFVVKLDAAGAYQWSKGVGSPTADVGYGVATDVSDSVFLTGSFNGTIDFGGGPLTSAGFTDVFIVKYGENGAHQWSTRLGGPSSDTGQGIGADANNCVIVTGEYDGALLVKYDTNGAQEWSRTFDGSSMVQGLDLAVSAAGTIAITGNLRGTADFGGGPMTSAGDDDIFLAVFETNGAHNWSQRFGDSGDDWGYGCAFDASNNLMAAGIFSESVDFGGGLLVSEGLADVYLVKFVVDVTSPVIACPADVVVEETMPEGTPATDPAIAAFLAGASAFDDRDPAPEITHDAPAIFPRGATNVTFRATDASGNHAECTAVVTVRSNTPPQLTVILDKYVLWPPNNQFVTVCAEVTVSDIGDGEPRFWLVSITSNEATTLPGGGPSLRDIQNAVFGTPDLCFDLRAARSGNGNGRVYQIVYAASDGTSDACYDTVEVRVPHDMSEPGPASQTTALKSVHPNPFNPQTTLEYTVSAEERVRINIYDARGKLVLELVNQIMPAGDHRVTWNGLDRDGRTVGSGVYFVRLAAGPHVDTRKIVLLK